MAVASRYQTHCMAKNLSNAIFDNTINLIIYRSEYFSKSEIVNLVKAKLSIGWLAVNPCMPPWRTVMHNASQNSILIFFSNFWVPML